jgi:hypothetical protein
MYHAGFFVDNLADLPPAIDEVRRILGIESWEDRVEATVYEGRRAQVGATCVSQSDASTEATSPTALPQVVRRDSPRLYMSTLSSRAVMYMAAALTERLYTALLS